MSAAQRLVVVAATRHGARLAQRIGALPNAEVHVAARYQDDFLGSHAIDVPLAEALARWFRDPTVSGLVVVLAVGATVRLLAPWLRGKEQDPAVVCVDDGGRFAVALLSGHRGGANELARRVADALGACPVITTASDMGGVLAVDLLGADAGWRIEATPLALRRAAAAVINGDAVGVYQDAGDTAWQTAPSVPANVRVLACLADSDDLAALLVISDRVLDLSTKIDCSVVYRTPTLVAGVGCSTGIKAEEVAAVVDRALAQGGLARGSLARVATIDRRLKEPGLLEFAREAGVPLEGYPADALAAVAGTPNPSAVVQAAVGTPGVCEPAALLASGADYLVVPKVKAPRATVAIARIPARDSGG